MRRRHAAIILALVLVLVGAAVLQVLTGEDPGPPPLADAPRPADGAGTRPGRSDPVPDGGGSEAERDGREGRADAASDSSDEEEPSSATGPLPADPAIGSSDDLFDGTTVIARLLDPSGRPLAGARGRSIRPEGEVIADEDGAIRWIGIAPGYRTYRLVVRHEGTTYGGVVAFHVPSGAEEVRLDAVLKRPADLRVSLDRSVDGQVRVRPVEPTGGPIAEARAPAIPGFPAGRSEDRYGEDAWHRPGRPETSTDDTLLLRRSVTGGEPVRFGDLVPGTYDVAVEGSESWGSRRVRLLPGGNEVLLEVRPAGAIEGQVTDPDGEGTEAWVQVRPAGDARDASTWSGDAVQTTGEGRFVLSPLPPGSWRLRALGVDPAHSRAEAEVEVRPGRIARVVFPVEEGREARVALDPRNLGDPDALLDGTAYGPPGVRTETIEGRTLAVRGLAEGDEAVVVLWTEGWEQVGRTTVRAGEEEAAVHLVDAAVVEGRVVGREGEGVGPGARVRLVPAWAELASSLDDPRNPFSPEALPVVRQDRPDRARLPADAATGTTSPGPDGSIVLNTASDGAFGPRRLVPGRWRVEVPGGETRELHLVGGDRRELELRVE